MIRQREAHRKLVWTPNEHVRIRYASVDILGDCLVLHEWLQWDGSEWRAYGENFPDGDYEEPIDEDHLRFIQQEFGIPDGLFSLESFRTLAPKRLRALSQAISALGSEKCQLLFKALSNRGVILVTFLGGGGWGFVFHVRDSGKDIALKVLRPPYQREWEKRFRREADFLAKTAQRDVTIEGPVVPHVEEVNGLLCVHMELIDGRPLSELVLPTSPLAAAVLIRDTLVLLC